MINNLSSDNKALKDKVDQFINQGDEKGVTNLSLQLRYSELQQTNRLVEQQHNNLVDASHLLKAQCQSAEKITASDISRTVQLTYNKVVTRLEDELREAQNLVEDLKKSTSQGVVSVDMINDFLIATCNEHRFGNIPDSCWNHVNVHQLSIMQNPLRVSALPLRPMSPTIAILHEEAQYLITICKERTNIQESLKRRINKIMSDANRVQNHQNDPAPVTLGHFYKTLFINEVVLPGIFECPQCVQQSWTPQFCAPLSPIHPWADWLCTSCNSAFELKSSCVSRSHTYFHGGSLEHLYNNQIAPCITQ